MKEEEDLSILLRQLDEGFRDLPIPPAERLIRGDSIYSLEASETHEKFCGRHWRDLSFADLRGESAALSFFTPEAFRFFLPAFIRISLLDPEAADLIPDAILWSLALSGDATVWDKKRDLYLEAARAHNIPATLISELAPVDDPDLDDFRKKRIAALAPSQRQAVISFIQFMRKYKPAGELAARDLDCAEEALRRRTG